MTLLANCPSSCFAFILPPRFDPIQFLAQMATSILLLGSMSASLCCGGLGWMDGESTRWVYREAGIVARIPENGLPVRWRTPCQGGYAGPAVADGKVFVFDFVVAREKANNVPEKRSRQKGQERLLVLDAATGAERWQYSYDCAYNVSYPSGPRCTPTIDQDRVYLLGSQGRLTCLQTDTGKEIWKVSLKEDFSAKVPHWGFAAHPLVQGELLYTMVGGKGQGVVAFDKMTGEVRWKQLSGAAGYCPPSILEIGETKQLLVVQPNAIRGMSLDTGKTHWSVDIKSYVGMTVNRPMLDGNLLFASAASADAVLLRLSNNGMAATTVWHGVPRKSITCCNSTPMLVNGVIYGVDCDLGALVAVDGETGERLWSSFAPTQPDQTRFLKHGTAFLTRLGTTNRYFLMSENGDLIMADLTRDSYRELGRMHVLKPTGSTYGRSVVLESPCVRQPNRVRAKR